MPDAAHSCPLRTFEPLHRMREKTCAPPSEGSSLKCLAPPDVCSRLLGGARGLSRLPIWRPWPLDIAVPPRLRVRGLTPRAVGKAGSAGDGDGRSVRAARKPRASTAMAFPAMCKPISVWLFCASRDLIARVLDDTTRALRTSRPFASVASSFAEMAL